ncbi:tail fibre assembly protein [uncultured Mediterranean phage uvMED]|nr:tail fibre assembly protein [uncultured Mediterranean phage uvMED]BAR37068.1 tail fibre assembly protein [uncultured Mediterranean phage uvMED]
MVDRYVDDNGARRLATADELAEINARETAWNNDAPNRKLKEIKQIRLEKLIETDYLANSDVTMPDNIKTWRQTLRDIPANHTDENAYDLLLARNDAGELTHSIWSKP